MPFPTHFQRWPSFLWRVSPIVIDFLVFSFSLFFLFLQNNSKDKYNKDFLNIIFTDKKIKNPAKIRRPTQSNALGSKVPMFVYAFSKDNYSWRPKTRITFYRLSSMGRLHSKKLFPVLSEWQPNLQQYLKK